MGRRECRGRPTAVDLYVLPSRLATGGPSCDDAARSLRPARTDEIAHAFLTRPPTVAQRIVRAKAKIRVARIPYEVPSKTDLPDRLDAVLRVVYLVFNEGYSASSGESLTRHDLSSEAIGLGRLLVSCSQSLKQ